MKTIGATTLYLKRKHTKDGTHYILSESYRDGNLFKHRRLIDLGPDPEMYIEYPGGNSFHIRESLLEDLQNMGEGYSEDELENLLMPFIDPHIRRIVERFQRSGKSRKPWHNLSPEERMQKQKNIHSFDKRRIHYLRFGRMQMGDMDQRACSFLYGLFDKSRDEIEHVIEEMERELPPHEIRPYIYTSFHLQTHFMDRLTRNHPSALDPEKVDDFLVDDLCRLNSDKRFFSGVDRRDFQTLHPYLIKYLTQYFDNAFEPGTVWSEYVEDFLWKHQFHRQSKASPGASPSEEKACLCLEISMEDFQGMDRTKLRRCYRRLAKKTHPDGGGNQERFVEIKEAYEFLLQKVRPTAKT